jgi:hypothetical protein
MRFFQFIQNLFLRLYVFLSSFFGNVTDDFPWMLKKRTKHIIPPKLMNEIVSTLDKEILYAKMIEREPNSSVRFGYYSLDQFIQKYSLIPRPLRLELLDMAFENYKQEKKENRRRISFYDLSILLINLLFDYEEFKKEEDLEFLKNDLFHFLSVRQSRIFNFLLDNLNKNFRKKYARINARDLQYTKVVWQIKNEVAYRPLMVKYYEHQESFNSHIGM